MSAAKTPWHRTLRRGMRGADVRALQRLVGVKADGKFGAQTEEAVKRWQRNANRPGMKNLVADGEFGKKSQKRSQELKSAQPAKSNSSGSATKPAAPAKTTKRRRKRKPRAADMPRSQKKTQKTTKTRTADCPLKAAKPKNARRSKKPKDAKKEKLKPCGYKLLRVSHQPQKPDPDLAKRKRKSKKKDFPFPKYTAKTLQVIAASSKGGGEKVTMDMAQDCGFCQKAPSGHKHASIEVFDRDTKKVLKKVESKKIEYEVLSRKPKTWPVPCLGFIALFKRFYFPTIDPGQYEFVSHACGRPVHSKDRVYGGRVLNVDAFSYEQYKLSIELNPMMQKKRTEHRARKDGKSYYSVQQEHSNNLKKKKIDDFVKHVSKVQKGDAKVEVSTDKGLADKLPEVQKAVTIKFQRTSGDLTSHIPPIAELVKIYEELFGAVNSFQNLLNSFPKVGWYFELQCMWLQGSLEVEWGYKEAEKSWQVYRGLKLTSKITLFKGVAEIGFGAKLGKRFRAAELVVYGLGSGEFALVGEIESQPPPQPNKNTAKIEGKFELALGIRCVVAGKFAKAEAKAVTAIVAWGGIVDSQSKPPQLNYEVKWEGIKVELKIGVVWGLYSYTKKWSPFQETVLLPSARWRAFLRRKQARKRGQIPPDCSWDALHSHERKQWEALGWNKTRWNKDQGASTQKKDWAELSTSERKAAEGLGFTKNNWANDDKK